MLYICFIYICMYLYKYMHVCIYIYISYIHLFLLLSHSRLVWQNIKTSEPVRKATDTLDNHTENWHWSPSLFYKHIVSERLSLQYNKISFRGFQKSEFPNSLVN